MLSVSLGSPFKTWEKVPKKGSEILASRAACRGYESCAEPHGFVLGTEASFELQGSATAGLLRLHWVT